MVLTKLIRATFTVCKKSTKSTNVFSCILSLWRFNLSDMGTHQLGTYLTFPISLWPQILHIYAGMAH